MEYGYGYFDNIYLTLETMLNTIDIRSIILSTPLNKYKLKEGILGDSNQGTSDFHHL